MMRLPFVLAVLGVLVCAALAAEEVKRDAETPALEERKVKRDAETPALEERKVKRDAETPALEERKAKSGAQTSAIEEKKKPNIQQLRELLAKVRNEEKSEAQPIETREGHGKPQSEMARKSSSKILSETKRTENKIKDKPLQRKEKVLNHEVRRNDIKRSLPNHHKGSPTKKTMNQRNPLRHSRTEMAKKHSSQIQPEAKSNKNEFQGKTSLRKEEVPIHEGRRNARKRSFPNHHQRSPTKKTMNLRNPLRHSRTEMAKKRSSKIQPEAKRNENEFQGKISQRKEEIPIHEGRRNAIKRSFPNHHKGSPTKKTMNLRNLLRQSRTEMAKKRSSKIQPEAKRNENEFHSKISQRKEEVPIHEGRRNGIKRSFPNHKQGNPTKKSMNLRNLLRKSNKKKSE